MAKTLEQLKKERGFQETNNILTNKRGQTAPATPKRKTIEDLKKERGYVEPEIDYWKEQPIRTAAKNINTGINALSRGVVGVTDATIGNLGIKPVDNFVQRHKDYFAKEDAEMAKINKGHEIIGSVAQGAGQAISTLPFALLNPVAATGVGSVGMTAAGGTQLIANAAKLANPSTLNAARTVALNLKSNPSLYTSMVTSVGNQYLEGLNQGATREQAIKSAVIGGVPSALIEVSGGLENITNILANRTKGLMGKALQSALEEGLEEIVQYPVENMGQKIAFDKDMPYFSMQDQAIINPKEIAQAGFVGATVGGLFGGGAAGINSALNSRNSKAIDKQYKNTINNLPDDSPILARVNDMQDNNVNIDNDIKLWVINSARQQQGDFVSEIDKLMQENRQKETFVQNKNNNVEQISNEDNTFVKTQNKGSKTVNPILSTFNIQNIENAREVKQGVYEFYKNSIISDSNNSKPIVNKSSGMNVEISRATINQTFQADDKYMKNQDNEIKVAAMANVVDLIQNGSFEVVNEVETPSSKVKYAEIRGTVNVNGIPYEIMMDVRRTDNGKKLFVHSLSTNNQQVVNNSINKKNGVISSDIGERVRAEAPEVYTALNKLGSATKMKIKLVETIYDPSGTTPGFANGQYDPSTNTIEIALDSDNPTLVVAKHEITHVLQKESPELYQEYKDYVLGAMQENGTYQNEFNRMAALYRANGLEIDKDGIEDEIAADATERFLTDEAAINDLAANNPTLGQKILDILKAFIAKVENAIGKTANWLNAEQLKRAEELWVNALNDVAENKNQATGDKNSVKYSLEGYNDIELENMILANHSEYNNNKEALKLAREAIRDLSEVKYSISDKRGKVAGSGIRTIADGISREFINKGYIELKGRKIRNNEELAVLAQVFRDPRFETFRIFYTKNNKIVAHEAISSRIPGMTSAFLNVPKRSEYNSDFDFIAARHQFTSTRYDDMKDRMKRLKADGYYLLHNHPSGSPDASKADVSMTKGFMDNVEGFKGHVIINSNKYGWLEMGEYSYSIHVEDMVQQQIELFLKPTIDHPLLNESITGTDKAASIAKSLQLSKDKTAIVYADVKGVIRGIEEIPNGMFNDRVSIRGFLRNRARHFGSAWAFLNTDSKDIFSKSTNLIKEKYLIDSILLYGNDTYSHIADMNTKQDDKYEWAGIKSDEFEAVRVNEKVDDKRYSLKDLVFDDEIAGYTQERMDTIFDKYGAKSTPKYSKAYVAYMSPDEFLSLSTANLKGIESQSRKLDVGQLRNEYQDIFLQFDQDTNEITGHEGRHRMVALRNEGIKQVPVVFIPDGEKGRYNRSKIDNIRFEGQEFRNGRAPGVVEVNNMIPVSAEYKDELNSTFVRNRGIRFSLKDNQGRELTKEQQEFFKDSKIKDDKGNLLALHHGTKNDFNVFEPSRGGEFGSGVYLTDNKETAMWYAKYVSRGEGSPKTIETYVNITNPYTISKDEYIKKTERTTPNTLKKRLIKQGYDGIIGIGLNGYEKQYIAFEPEQIKEITNKNPTDNPDIRFSLKEPVEETKDLIAIHNIREDKLKGALELGGFPVPSIAILKAEQAHEGFGDISVIFTKDTIDPQFDRRNKVFASDVYSPTFPSIGYKYNDKVVKQIRDRIQAAVEGTDYKIAFPYNGNLEETNLDNAISRTGGDFAEAYKSDALFKVAYLKDKRINFKPVMKKKQYGSLEPKLITKIIGKLGDKIPAKYEGIDKTMEIEPELRQVINDFYSELMPDYVKYKEPMGFGQVDDVVRTINKYKTDTNRMTIDRVPTHEKLNRAVKEKDFTAWLKEISNGIIEQKGIRNDKDPFLPSGNRRSWNQTHDPYTLENVLKILKGGIRDEEGFNYGLGSLRANLSKEFKSVKDIKSNEGLLLGDKEFTEVKEQYSQEYYDLVSRAMEYHTEKYGDAFDISLSELAKKGTFTPSALKKELKADGFDNDIMNDEQLIKDSLDFLQKLKTMPTSYFEAKPQRAVYFDEIAAVVAPKTMDKELIQQLKDNNVKVIRYDEKVEGDRLKKVNSVKGVKFSLKDNKGNELSQQQAEYFQDSKIRDNDGNLKLVYHGGTVGNEFDTNRGKTATQFGSGAYFTDALYIADEWARERKGNIVEGYINITKPFDATGEGEVKKSPERDKLEKLLKEKGLESYEIRIAFYGNDYRRVDRFSELRKALFAKTGEKVGFDWNGAELANELIRQAGYDGIVGDLYDSQQYVVFNPEQMKLRDNANPSESTDIRYQLKDNRSSVDVERLQKINERLKEQFKLTKGVKLDEKAVKRYAGSLLKDYSSKYSKAELESKLMNLYQGIANDTIEAEDMQAAMTEIARSIIDNASVLNDGMYKQYADLRNTLRNTAISINDRYKDDFKAVGGWNAFRKKNLGRINLTNDGMDIDSLYQELSDMYPELFLKDVANPADQLMLINDVLDNLVPIYENPYNRDLNEAVDYLALEIFNDMTSIPEAKPTFADRKKAEKQKAVASEKAKAKEKLDELRAKNANDIAWLKYQNKEKISQVLDKEKVKRDAAIAKVRKQYQGEAYKTWWRNKLNENDIKSHYQEMITELRADRDEKLEKQKSKYQERISGIYEDRKIRQAKDSIGRKTKRLDAMLRKPSQKQHIPKVLNKTIAELLAMLDFTTDKQKENTILKLRDIRAEYEKIAKVSDEDGISATADPFIMEALEMLHDKRVADMNLQEIELLRDIIGYFENLVKTYNKAFVNGKWVDIAEKSDKIMNELSTDKVVNESAYGMIQNFKNMMNWGMVTPQMFFERMGNAFTDLWTDFRDALDVKISNTKTAQDYMNNLLAGSKDKIKEWTGNKAEVKTIKLNSGKTIELTQAQLMSFYLLMKREQARGHIFGLGIKAAPIVTTENRIKRIKKQFEPVKISLNDAERMIGMLTKEQRKIADGIGVFMNTYSKQWVNEATLKNYGYELAKEENYFPIKSDRDFLKSDFDNTNLDPTFTSMGFLKATVKGAGNAIIIEDVFDVFTEHADKAATYNAFLGITENTKKIINFKTKEDSVKQAMNKKYGNQAFSYLKKFMVDLQGGIRAGESDNPLIKMSNTLIRNTKRSMLGLNLRTVVQQPTAIIRASAVIDAKYLIKGTSTKGDKAEMLKHSPIALWKSWGYFNLDTGRTMRDIILDTTPILDKQYIPIQISDDITWTKIWNAVKLEIEENEPGLKVGSKEYFEAVSDRFTEIIDKTQVVDTVMHRSALMRDKDSLAKLSTSFMSEPTKAYNMLLNAAEKYKNDNSSDNKKELTRTISAWMATMLVNTLVVTMIDMWRRKEEDQEGMASKYLGNLLNDVTGYVPLVRDIYSIAQGYSVKRMEYYGVEKLVRAMQRTGNYVDEITEGKKHKYPLRLITKDWIEGIAYNFGIGAANVTRELEALLRNYTKWIDDEGTINDIYEFMFKK